MNRLRVLLVDTSDDFLDGLAAWLAGERSVEVVGKARNGADAVDQVDRLRPDLVVMDLSMSTLNGFEATREMKATPGSPKVVLTTFHASEAVRSEAKAAGADDVIAKAEVLDGLRRLIEAMAAATPGEHQPTGSDEDKSDKGFLSQ